MKKFFEPITGIISGGVTFTIMDDILTAIVVAFFTGAAAWLGKELCVHVKMVVIKKRKRNESGTDKA